MYVLRSCLTALLSIVVIGCSQYPDRAQDEAHAQLDAGLRQSARSRERPPIVSDRFILNSPDQQVVGRIQVLVARHKDTFVDIGRSYNLGFDELVQANPGIDPWLPGEDTPIILPTQFVLPDAPREGIILNVASKRLFYFPETAEGEPQVVVTFPIGIGRYDWATPLGTTEVISKARDPVWYVPRSVRREYAEEGDYIPPTIEPGPDNPLGKYVLGLGMKSYLIHGTNRPAGVGMRVSHGCIRLFNIDMEYMFDEIAIGVSVSIVNQPFLLGWLDGQLYLEAHPPLIEDTEDWAAWIPAIAAAAVEGRPNGSAAVDYTRINDIVDAKFGFPVPILNRSRGMQATIRNAMHVINLVTYDHLIDPEDIDSEFESEIESAAVTRR